MRKIFSYANSHRYEIHALLAATFVVVLMSLIKGPIKRKLAQSVERKIAKQPVLEGKRRKLIRQKNMLLICLTMLLSIGVFAVVAKLSPLIEFSFPTAVMSGVFALCEYAFFDQITFDIREEEKDE